MTAPFKIATLLLIGSMAFFACKKPVLEDDSLLPDDQLGLYFTDTLTVLAEVVRDDSVRSDELAVNVWGSYVDPVFGQTNAGIYFQMSTDRNNIDFGDNLTYDSIVLTLLYNTTYKGYGDTTIPQNLRVYRVTEPFFKDTSYYQFHKFNTEPTPLATVSGFVPNFKDSVVVNDSVKYGPGIRIKLADAFGQQILANSGQNNLASDAAFKAFLNGLYLAPDTINPGGGLVYFDMFAANTKLTIYYNGGESYDFLINSNSGSVNHVTQSYNGTPVGTAINNGNNNDEVLYLQPRGGAMVRVTIPHIDSLKNIAINKAELVFVNLGTDTALYPTPPQLIFTQNLKAGGESFLPEVTSIGIDFAGGAKTTEDGKVVYKLNIPRYLSQVRSAGEQFGINLLPFPTAREANRVILGGSTHPTQPLKLRLTYTKID